MWLKNLSNPSHPALEAPAYTTPGQSLGFGDRVLRPCRAEHLPGRVPGALPRAGMLRAVGASS